MAILTLNPKQSRLFFSLAKIRQIRRAPNTSMMDGSGVAAGRQVVRSNAALNVIFQIFQAFLDARDPDARAQVVGGIGHGTDDPGLFRLQRLQGPGKAPGQMGERETTGVKRKDPDRINRMNMIFCPGRTPGQKPSQKVISVGECAYSGFLGCLGKPLIKGGDGQSFAQGQFQIGGVIGG